MLTLPSVAQRPGARRRSASPAGRVKRAAADGQSSSAQSRWLDTARRCVALGRCTLGARRRSRAAAEPHARRPRRGERACDGTRTARPSSRRSARGSVRSRNPPGSVWATGSAASAPARAARARHALCRTRDARGRRRDRGAARRIRRQGVPRLRRSRRRRHRRRSGTPGTGCGPRRRLRHPVPRTRRCARGKVVVRVRRAPSCARSRSPPGGPARARARGARRS